MLPLLRHNIAANFGSWASANPPAAEQPTVQPLAQPAAAIRAAELDWRQCDDAAAEAVWGATTAARSSPQWVLGADVSSSPAPVTNMHVER